MRPVARTASTAVCIASCRSRAVEVRGERLPDAANGLAQPGPLLGHFVDAPRELVGHLIELVAEGGGLVVALGRDARLEVTPGDSPSGLEKPGELCLQRA